jgi:MFS family permease
MNTWGYIQSFGAFQTYFDTILTETPSDISWIGSIQIFLQFTIGMFSGRALDAGYFKPVFFLGLMLQMLGIFTLALSTKYWQIFLAQGVAQGLGGGLQFCPTMSLLSTYFDKKRATAIGLVSMGSSVGGLVYPSIVRALLPEIGFPWTVRVCGFISLAIGLICGIFLKPRLPPRRSGPLVELEAFKEPPFLFFCIGNFLLFWGLFFAFYYVSNIRHPTVALSSLRSSRI